MWNLKWMFTWIYTGKTTVLKQKAIDAIKEGRKAFYITLTSADVKGNPKKVLGIFDILSKLEMLAKGVQMLDVNDLQKHFHDYSNTDLSGSDQDFMAVDVYKWLSVFIQAHPKDTIMVDEFPIIGSKNCKSIIDCCLLLVIIHALNENISLNIIIYCCLKATIQVVWRGWKIYWLNAATWWQLEVCGSLYKPTA